MLFAYNSKMYNMKKDVNLKAVLKEGACEIQVMRVIKGLSNDAINSDHASVVCGCTRCVRFISEVMKNATAREWLIKYGFVEEKENTIDRGKTNGTTTKKAKSRKCY
jgi:hypothetical protein